MTLTERIKVLADEKKTTFAEIERNVGISNGQIRRWDTSSPKIENIQRVADFFSVSTDYLLGRSETKTLATPPPSVEDELTMFFRINTEDLSEGDKKDLEEDLKDYMAIRAKRLRERNHKL